MSGLEAVLFWLTALFLAATFFLSWAGVVFRRERLHRLAYQALILGTVALTGWSAIRWARSGHPPFVTLFESMTASVWFLLIILHMVRARVPQLRIVILPASGAAFLLMGWASGLSTQATPLSEALTNTWLFIHASFATAGAAAFLAAASLSVVFLLGPERLEGFRGSAGVLPEHARLPRIVADFVLFGLLLWGVMIASGSIWAHLAWGRYWAWDPIELWSLISWLLYGLLLHARFAFRLSKQSFCRLTILAAATIVFTLWGVHYVYRTVHSYG